MAASKSKNIFKVRMDQRGDLFYWTRTQNGCTWTSTDAYISDIEAAHAAYCVAGTYPNSELHLGAALHAALLVWRFVTQYVAKVEVVVN